MAPREQDLDVKLFTEIRNGIVELGASLALHLERTNALLEQLAAINQGTSMRSATEQSFTHVKLAGLVADVAALRTLVEAGNETRLDGLERAFHAMQHELLDTADQKLRGARDHLRASQGLQTPALTASLSVPDRLASIEKRLADLERWTRGEP